MSPHEGRQAHEHGHHHNRDRRYASAQGVFLGPRTALVSFGVVTFLALAAAGLDRWHANPGTNP